MVKIDMTGRLIVDAVTTLRQLETRKAAAPCRIEITKNGVIEPYSCYNYLFVGRRTFISGEGPFRFGVGTRGSEGVICENSISADIDFRCPVENKYIGGEPPEEYTPRLCFYNGGSVVTFAGGSTIRGDVVVRQTGWVTLDAASLGLRGTYGSFGDVDFVLSRDAVLRYSGAGETTDRSIMLTNANGMAEGRAGVQQAGTGPLTMNSAVRLAEGVSSGTFSLSGASGAPAVFSGTLGDGIALVKKGSGEWTFTPVNGFSGPVSLQGGVLRFGRSLHLAQLAVTESARVSVVDGATLELDALSVADGKNLSIVPEGAQVTVRIAGVTAGTAIPGVTLNGHPAVVDENQSLVLAEGLSNFWKSPVSGLWTDATKWAGDTVPDPTQDILIDAVGPDYTVTLGENETLTTTNLIVHNHGSGTATLLVTNARLTVKGHTTSQPVLQIGEGGRLDVVDSVLNLRDQGNARGYISDNSSLSMGRDASVVVRGTSEFRHTGILQSERLDSGTGNLNTHFTTGGGTLLFEDDAVFTLEQDKTANKTVFYHNVQPSAPRETARLVFAGRSRPKFSFQPWSLRIRPNSGYAAVAFDSDHGGRINNLWNQTFVGTGNGLGELFIRKGDYEFGNYDMFHIATSGSDTTSSSACFVTGRVEVASGASLLIHGTMPLTDSFGGFSVGHGIPVRKDRGASCLHGEFVIDGAYTQEAGNFIVGGGAAGEGEVVQGEESTVRIVNGSEPAANRLGEVAIGVFGGQGVYRVNGGTFATKRNVYVGGATTNDLHRPHVNGAFLNEQHGAYGLLEISGGSFSTTMNVVLGCDGTGVLALSGTGSLSAAALIVSNTVGQAASEIRFTADAQGRCGMIASDTALAFQPGAKVTVDVSAAAAAGATRVIAWKLAAAPEGLADADIELVGSEEVDAPNELALSSDGRTLVWNVFRGTVLIIR